LVHSARLCCAITLLIVVFLAVGCGGSGGSKGPAKVNAAEYVKSVCSAILPLERDVVARSQAVTKPSPSATKAKATLEGFLAAIEQDSNRALSQIRSAGTPDISQGTSVATSIVQAFTRLRDAIHTAAGKADALPTDSPSSYSTAAQALNTSVRASLSNIDPSGFRNPDVEKAANKQAACKSLNG
jgi:hypothetical protein